MKYGDKHVGKLNKFCHPDSHFWLQDKASWFVINVFIEIRLMSHLLIFVVKLRTFYSLKEFRKRSYGGRLINLHSSCSLCVCECVCTNAHVRL